MANSDGDSSSDNASPIVATVYFRPGEFGSGVRARKNFPSIDINIKESTTIPLIVATIASRIPSGFTWDAIESPLRYAPTSNSISSQHLILSEMRDIEDDGLYTAVSDFKSNRISHQAKRARKNEDWKFCIFVYGGLANTSARNPGIQRATASRIAAQSERLSVFNRAYPMSSMGPLQTSYTSRVLARQSDNSSDPLTLATMPSPTATSVQISFLDTQIQNDQPVQEPQFKPLTVKMNGVVQEIFVDVKSLRSAIGMPNINLDGISTFNDPIIIPDPMVDMDDTDHIDNN